MHATGCQISYRAAAAGASQVPTLLRSLPDHLSAQKKGCRRDATALEKMWGAGSD
jgi:hypothetical protein